jgi:hypothetical protein
MVRRRVATLEAGSTQASLPRRDGRLTAQRPSLERLGYHQPSLRDAAETPLYLVTFHFACFYLDDRLWRLENSRRFDLSLRCH